MLSAIAGIFYLVVPNLAIAYLFLKVCSLDAEVKKLREDVDTVLIDSNSQNLN